MKKNKMNIAANSRQDFHKKIVWSLEGSGDGEKGKLFRGRPFAVWPYDVRAW